MNRILRAALAAFALALACSAAMAQSAFPTPGGSYVDGKAFMCLNGAGLAVPCSSLASVSASTTATTLSFSASLPATPNKTNILCGFVITSGGTTTAAVVNGTITGAASGTMNFAYVFPSTGQGLLGVALPQCIQASAPNTAITVSVPAGGAGTTAALSMWGYQQ